MTPIAEIKLFPVIPIIGIWLIPETKDISINGMVWTAVLLTVISIICALYVLESISVKDEDIVGCKQSCLTAFWIYVVTNLTYLGLLYFYHTPITDIHNVYWMCGLFVAQAFIFIFFLSNLYPPAKDQNESASKNLTQ